MKTTGINWDNLRFFLAVARAQSVQEAAAQLDIDHSTITRRLHRLEAEMEAPLFDRTSSGHALTPGGHRLLEHVERMESALFRAETEVGGAAHALSGDVRLGSTEGFGSYFLAPHLAHFCDRHPAIAVELLPVPRFVNLSRREADMSISIERSEAATHVVCKLTDYRLLLYASRDYLAAHPRIRAPHDLAAHRLAGYVDDLCFSSELRYLNQVAAGAAVPFKSTSVVAQLMAARQGKCLAILPCFLAAAAPELTPVLAESVRLTRTFWLAAPAERRDIVRVRVLWDYLRAAVKANQAFLRGETAQMAWVK